MQGGNQFLAYTVDISNLNSVGIGTCMCNNMTSNMMDTAVKPAVQLLQIQEVHPVAHSNACNFCRFLSIFLTCSI